MKKKAIFSIIFCVLCAVFFSANALADEHEFTLTVMKGAADPLANVNCYVFDEGGSYLSISGTTDENGQVSFDLSEGTYRIRVDYLGYQFWTEVYDVPTTLSDEFIIDHQDVIITVEGTYQGSSDPIEGINVYLFTASGSYVNRSQVTDTNGQLIFSLPEQSYKVRADYLGQQFWSEAFTWMGVSIVIEHGLAHIHVTRSGADLDGANVYLFTESGSYLSRSQTTDTSGAVEFLIPAGSYKFRADEGGDQQWSAVTPVIADLVTNVEIEMEEFPPTVTIVEPDGVNDIADTSYTIQWTDDDPDDNATISLYYDSDNADADGTLIVSGVNEDPDGPGNDEYVWNTSAIADGTYWVYAVIDDGQNNPVIDYSEGSVTIDHSSGIPDEVKLTASDAGADDWFGYWADIDDDYTIVGSPLEDENGVDSGAAYIFKRNENTWTEQAKITAGDAEEGDLFGISVSIDGDYAIVGARGDENEKGAAYVFRLEGAAWVEQAKLIASDAEESDSFGSSVSIDGDYAIVGAYGDDNLKGAAYVFRLEGAAWVEQAKLTGSDAEEWWFFGSSVSICGEYAIIGANYADYGLGAAYIFKLDGDVWMQQTRLTTNDVQEMAFFGNSVSICGEYAIIGANYADYGLGAAYTFKLDGNTWTEQAKLTASDAEEWDLFGISVSIDGDYAIVGARGDENEKGAAYVFRLEGAAWVEQAKLTATDGEENDHFGWPVAINGLSAIVGSSGDDDRGADSGAVYIYTIDEGTGPPSITITEPDGINDTAIVSFAIQWTDFDPDDNAAITLYYDNDNMGTDGILIVSGLSEDPDDDGSNEYVWDVSLVQEGTYYVYAVIDDGENDPVIDYSDGPITVDHTEMGLTAGNPSLGAQFGYSVDMDGGSVIVGAWGEDNNRGSASIFNLYTGFNEQAKLTAGDGQEDDNFGHSVAVSGDYAIVGAYGADNYRGAAYIFKYDGSTWIEQAKLIAGDGAEYDCFGYSVSISGDYAVVGALYADEGAGAAYTFTRDGETWIQEAKLTAIDGVANDYFGGSVAIDGDYIVIGAWAKPEWVYGWGWLSESGAAYVFKRTGEDWVERSKLTRVYGAWNYEMGYDAGYRFGYSVAIDDPYLIVGASGQQGTEAFSPGAAYVFNRQGERWTIQGTLTAANPQNQDYFGSSVAIDDDYAIVGAPGEYGWTDPPAAYVFEWNGGVWTLDSSLASGETTVDDQFGTSVALNGAYAIVGAPGAYGNTDYPGAAYVYSIYQVDICADDEEIVYGDSTTLSWDFVGATSVTIDNGVGEVFESGSIAVSPTENTTYTITATGPWGTYTDTVTVTVEPLGIFIDSPWDGDTIVRPYINVKGTILNPLGLEVGLTVNGVFAVPDGNQFVANHVPLQEGENTITAAAVGIEGNTVTDSITVYADTTGNYVRITADPESGVAPFETTLEIETTFTFTGDPVLTYTGPGTVEFPDQDEYNVLITAPGVYTFTVEATDDQSNIYTDTLAVEVLDLTQLDTLLTGKWDGMSGSLMNSDIENALDFFHDSSKDEYQEIFELLIDDLPDIASEMGEIEVIYVRDTLAKYRITREEEIQGQTYDITYFIDFIKGTDGLWRIESF